MTPGSVSLRLVSKILAMYGIADTVKGTTAALVPIALPMIRRVNGMMMINRMMNGNERKMLTISDNVS